MSREALPLLAVALLSLSACPRPEPRREGDRPCVVDAGEGNRPFFAGSDADRKLLEGWVDALGTAHGEALLKLGGQILSRGEAAVPPLLAALRSDNAQRRGQAAYLLGFTKDRRTVPALAEAANDPVPAVRYEVAGALLELRDPRGLPILVDGLEDSDARLRAKCIAVLAERTGQRFGFEADGAVEDRAAAVRRWRMWLAPRPRDGG